MSNYKLVYYAADGYLLTEYFGEVSLQDLEASLDEGMKMYPDADSIADFSQGSLKNITKRDFESLLERAIANEPQGIWSALVASGNLEYCMARMFDARAQGKILNTRGVFRTRAEAVEWIRQRGKQGQ